MTNQDDHINLHLSFVVVRWGYINWNLYCIDKLEVQDATQIYGGKS